MNIGLAIKNLRKERGVKQGAMSKAIGMTQPYLSLIEKGKRVPTVSMLSNIADYFELPIAILFWFTIEESDIKEGKKQAYETLKPSIDTMISSIF